MEEKWVECVDGLHCPGVLTEGKKYRVVSSCSTMTRVLGDDGHERYFNPSRFKATSPPEPKPKPPEVSCVRCYSNAGYEGSLTVGRLYEVVACPLGFKHVGPGTHILDDNGKFCWYDNAHFIEPKPMEKAEEPEQERWVRCTSNAITESELTIGRVYKVIPDPVSEEKGYIRVLNDRGSDVSYFSSRFEDCPPPSRSIEEVAKGIVETIDDEVIMDANSKTALAKLLNEFAYAVIRGAMKVHDTVRAR